MTPVDQQPDAEAIERAIRACPSVADLASGAFGEIATYLPGKRVAGIRTRDNVVEVHVVALYGHPVSEIDTQVRDAVRPELPEGMTLNVSIDDVVTEQELAEQRAAEEQRVAEEQRAAEERRQAEEQESLRAEAEEKAAAAEEGSHGTEPIPLPSGQDHPALPSA